MQVFAEPAIVRVCVFWCHGAPMLVDGLMDGCVRPGCPPPHAAQPPPASLLRKRHRELCTGSGAGPSSGLRSPSWPIHPILVMPATRIHCAKSKPPSFFQRTGIGATQHDKTTWMRKQELSHRPLQGNAAPVQSEAVAPTEPKQKLIRHHRWSTTPRAWSRNPLLEPRAPCPTCWMTCSP